MPMFRRLDLDARNHRAAESMAVPESTAVFTCACKLLTAKALNKSTTSAPQTIFPSHKASSNLDMVPPPIATANSNPLCCRSRRNLEIPAKLHWDSQLRWDSQHLSITRFVTRITLCHLGALICDRDHNCL